MVACLLATRCTAAFRTATAIFAEATAVGVLRAAPATTTIANIALRKVTASPAPAAPATIARASAIGAAV